MLDVVGLQGDLMSASFSDIASMVAVGISLLALFQTMRSRGGDLLITASREKAELYELLTDLVARTSGADGDRQALSKLFDPESGTRKLIEGDGATKEVLKRLLSELSSIGKLDGPLARFRAERALIRLQLIRAQAQTCRAWVEDDEQRLATLKTKLYSNYR